MSEKKSIRLGIVGLGNMGALHAKSILDGKVPGVELAAVADRDPAKLGGFQNPDWFRTEYYYQSGNGALSARTFSRD